MNSIPWWGYVILAGLAWGTYVPIVFFGGSLLSPLSPAGTPIGMGGRLASILCVGVAYFFLAVLIPLAMMALREDTVSTWKPVGLVFSGLAGVAGAVGAICVIFASKAAVDAAKAEGVNPATYRMFIAPLIFALAPAINTLLSLVWHPTGDKWWNTHFEMPGWKLPVGIIIVAIGTFLVLMSKEEMEANKKKPPTPATTPAPVEPTKT